MRHQRHFAQPARALVGVEHLVQHVLARRGLGLDDPARPRSAPRCPRSACPGRTAAWSRRTWPSTRLACGVVKTSSVGMLGLQVMPFLAVDAPPIHSWPSASPTVRSVPGPVKCRRVEILAVQPLGAGLAAPHCAPPRRRSGRRASTREAAKIASASFATATSSGIVREHLLGPGRVRIGDDVPVDVEAGDLFQRRLVGHGVGLVGARDLVRGPAPDSSDGLSPRDGEPGRVVGEGLGHALVEPAGGAVEARRRRRSGSAPA